MRGQSRCEGMDVVATSTKPFRAQTQWISRWCWRNMKQYGPVSEHSWSLLVSYLPTKSETEPYSTILWTFMYRLCPSDSLKPKWSFTFCRSSWDFEADFSVCFRAICWYVAGLLRNSSARTLPQTKTHFQTQMLRLPKHKLARQLRYISQLWKHLEKLDSELLFCTKWP